VYVKAANVMYVVITSDGLLLLVHTLVMLKIRNSIAMIGYKVEPSDLNLPLME
jgi:hypothetical protein